LLFSTLSQYAAARNLAEDDLLRGACFGSLLAGYLNGLLAAGTPFCDCALIAATALSGAVVFLLKGSEQQVRNAMQLTSGVMAGLLCDGAKVNCAGKLALGAGTALENAYVAMDVDKPVNAAGLTGTTLAETFHNINRVGRLIRSTIEMELVNILQERST